ncbi:MAG: ABC transporter ATPase [Pygmaiobacter massiliensis]
MNELIKINYDSEQPTVSGRELHEFLQVGTEYKRTVQEPADFDASNIVANIEFQKGPRDCKGSINGVLDTDLLEIVRDRLKDFQAGEFSARENACALTHIEEALMWMNRRVEDRMGRNVLGTYNK